MTAGCGIPSWRSLGRSLGSERGGELQRWRLPGTSSFFEALGDGEDEFFLMRASDYLNADGHAFQRQAERNRRSGKAGQVQPLRMAHGIAIAVLLSGAPVALAMSEGGGQRNGRAQDRYVLHLVEDVGAEHVALRARLQELLERHGTRRLGRRQVFTQHGTHLIFIAAEGRTEQMGDGRPEEEPPEIDGAVETLQS